MKNKKPLTIKQQQRKYRSLQWFTFAAEYLAIVSPYIVLGAVNFDEWFLYNPAGWKIGLGGSMALALMGIAVSLITFKKENEKLTDGYITLILSWLVVATCLHLLADIIYQISTIMYFGAIGLAGAFGLDITSKQMQKKANMYKSAIEEANKEINREQAKEEILENKKGKIEF